MRNTLKTIMQYSWRETEVTELDELMLGNTDKAVGLGML